MRFWRKMIALKSLVKNHYSILAYTARHYNNCWLCFWLGIVKWAYLPIYQFNLVYFRTQDCRDNQKKTVQILIGINELFTNGRISKLLVFLAHPVHGISSYIHGISSYIHGVSSYIHGISSYIHGVSSYILWHIILHVWESS